MAARPKIHLIDGSGYIFRAYHAIRPLSTSDGTPTHAVLGFAKMLHKLLRVEAPERVLMAFDTSEKNFRHDLYEAYKANRSEPPEDLLPQFPLIFELVTAMGLRSHKQSGFEADDVLATLARQAIDHGYQVVLVTGDKDLMQLVGPHLTIFDPMKDAFFVRDDVVAKFGVPPERVGDLLALAGDVSDNVPGVPRCGPKTAAKLLQAHGSLEGVIAALAKQDKRKAVEQAVVDHQESARLSRKLVALDDHVPLTFDAEAMAYAGPRRAALPAFFHRVEARGLMRDFQLEDEPSGDGDKSSDASPSSPAQAAAATNLESDGAAAPPAAVLRPAEEVRRLLGPLAGRASPTRPIERDAYRTILSEPDLEALAQSIRQAGLVSLDLETTSLTALEADIVGLSACVPDGTPVYLPLRHHYLGVPKQLPAAVVFDVLRPLLEDEAIAKVGQHLKYDALVLHRAGIALRGIAHDSMVAAYTLDPSRASYGLDAMSREFLGHETIAYDDVTGRGRARIPFSDVPIEQATTYAAEDADVALRLCQLLVARVYETHREALYAGLEMPLVPVLIAMEAAGIAIDERVLGELDREFEGRLRALEGQAEKILGRRINLASPKQLAQVFFEELKLPVGKKTKTGYSTDQSVLEALAGEHELPATVLQHRLLAKLKGTYVESLPRMRNSRDGRVHTSFQQTGTATGRLSSTDPNLQNIPVRGEDGRRIRAALVAEEGHVLLSADYSQIELRIMAHLSEDPHFIEAFRRGEDIHTRTAREILTHGQEPDKEARRRAKAINFGILYGLSEFGLSRQLGIPRAEAQAYIKAYFGRYGRIRGFLDDTIERGRERGYVETLLGRRRPLPNLRSQNGALRQAAERIAMNAPIQGSAADLIKVAMVHVHRDLRVEGARCRMLLQVHDELVLEVPKGEAEATGELLRRRMAEAHPLRVPLVVDVGVGPNWAEAH
jgi:DNA polymerase-1